MKHNLKKILYITDNFPPFSVGGAQVSTSLIVKEASKKYRCIVLVPNFQKKSWRFMKANIYPLLKEISLKNNSIKDFCLYGFRSIFKPIINYFITKKFIKKNRVDIIHIVATSHYFIPIIMAAVYSKKPTIVDLRGGPLICPIAFGVSKYEKDICNKNCFQCLLNPQKKRSKFLEMFRPLYAIHEILIFKILNLLLRNLLKSPNLKFVANSKFIKGQYTKERFSSEKINVIYNICNINHSKKVYHKENNIVFAGRVDKSKGIWDIIKALEILEDKSLKLYICGNGEDISDIKRYVKDNNISNINLLGKISNKEVTDLYKKSKIIVAPSIWPEPFGRYILESMATRTPLISTTTGGTPEGIKDHETGLLVEPNNPKQLAKAIKELLTNKKLYNKIVRNLGKEALKYSPKRIGTLRLRLYKQIIQNNKIHNKGVLKFSNERT